MNLNSIPASDDSYIWVLSNEAGRCLTVDPGSAEPVLKAIVANNWQPGAIFLTHHRRDHVGGVKELMEKFLQIVVYGPPETQDERTTQVIKDGEAAFALGHESSVIATPGHTSGHICYFSKPYLFCGDTLSSGGCGQLFKGITPQMHQSLKKLGALPDNTLAYCTHGHTLSNMKSALSIPSHGLSINDCYRKAKELQAKGQITLPVILKNERQINVFLRTEDIGLINVVSEETPLQQPEEHFA